MLSLLRENATLINTGRGPTIDEEALVQVLGARRDLTALLDVTHPEPPGSDSPLMSLPNIHISSHIAGSIGDEVRRMADLVIEEFDRYVAGQPLQHQVTREEFFALA
jgi:phosphoglycerate dehydrogenase-like enzyme